MRVVIQGLVDLVHERAFYFEGAHGESVCFIHPMCLEQEHLHIVSAIDQH